MHWWQERKTRAGGSRHSGISPLLADALLPPQSEFPPSLCTSPLASAHLSLHPEEDGERLLKTIRFCLSPPEKQSEANPRILACWTPPLLIHSCSLGSARYRSLLYSGHVRASQRHLPRLLLQSGHWDRRVRSSIPTSAVYGVWSQPEIETLFGELK